jgi:1-acyl-sn-glycerol-3-phosphate acyltransferase
MNERVVKMWEPFPFKVGPDYDFFPRSARFRAAAAFLRLLARTILPPFMRLAFGLRVRGGENARALRGSGFITVCNHVHFLDCAMVGCNVDRRRLAYVSQASNFKIPLVRHLVRGLGAVPLPESTADAVRLDRELRDRIASGSPVHVYPEGVLAPYCGRLREFKRGAFALAVETGAPILPYVVSFRSPGGLRKVLKRHPCIDLRILPPIYPRLGCADRAESLRLMEEVRAAMAAAIVEGEGDRSA